MDSLRFVQHRMPAVGSVVAVKGILGVSHLLCTANSDSIEVHCKMWRGTAKAWEKPLL